MATGKRYYWMKLKESFMTSDTIDYFMSQPNGANYVVLYQMLCLKTINTSGRLQRQIGEVIIPYDIPKIQRDCKWFSAEDINAALNLYKSFGLIYEDHDGILCMADHDSLVGSETDYAEKNRQTRARQQMQNSDIGGHNVSVDVSEDVSNDVSENVSIDIRDRDQRLDIRDKKKEIERRTAISVEAGRTGSPPVITLTLNTGDQFPISQEKIDEWKECYPSVDVMQQLRMMKSWLNDNPTRRKTKSGILRFCNNWLSKEQNSSGNARGFQPTPVNGGVKSGTATEHTEAPRRKWNVTSDLKSD